MSVKQHSNIDLVKVVGYRAPAGWMVKANIDSTVKNVLSEEEKLSMLERSAEAVSKLILAVKKQPPTDE